MAGNVLTGCRARFSLNGVKVGYATGVTLQETIDFQPIDVLDNIQTTEHAPTGYRVTLSARLVRIVGTTLKSQGFLAKQGTSPDVHLSNILSTGVLAASLEDSATGKVVANVEGVRISEQSMQVDARGVVGQNVTFVAIRVRDESDIA